MSHIGEWVYVDRKIGGIKQIQRDLEMPIFQIDAGDDILLSLTFQRFGGARVLDLVRFNEKTGKLHTYFQITDTGVKDGKVILYGVIQLAPPAVRIEWLEQIVQELWQENNP